MHFAPVHTSSQDGIGTHIWSSSKNIVLNKIEKDKYNEKEVKKPSFFTSFFSNVPKRGIGKKFWNGQTETRRGEPEDV